MLTLVLTRHGLTDRSIPEQHIGGGIDVPLNDAGRAEARALAGRLRSVDFERVVTSPLSRARETAEILARGGPLEVDPRLLEMDYGRWEGLTYEQIEHADGAYRTRWEARPDTTPCPGGESGNDVARRVRAFLEALLDRHRSEVAGESAGAARASRPDPRPVLAVAHSSTNRILICVALAIEIREFRRRLDQDQCNLTVLQWESDAAPDQGRLLVLNDTAHLHRADESPWA